MKDRCGVKPLKKKKTVPRSSWLAFVLIKACKLGHPCKGSRDQFIYWKGTMGHKCLCQGKGWSNSWIVCGGKLEAIQSNYSSYPTRNGSSALILFKCPLQSLLSSPRSLVVTTITNYFIKIKSQDLESLASAGPHSWT